MAKDDGYKIRNQSAIHFITFAVVKWVDVFTRQPYKDIVVDSLKYCQANKAFSTISQKRWPKQHSKRFQKIYQQPNYQSHNAQRKRKPERLDAIYLQKSRSTKQTDQKLNYVHQNPVTAGIVSYAEDYVYSSAKDYTGKQGLIEVDLLC